jgi:hypothetical protein
MRFAVNVERQVKRFRIAPDGQAKGRILSDAIEVLAQSFRAQEVPAMAMNSGLMQSHSLLQGMDPTRLVKLAGLGALIAIGYVGTQYILFVCYLQFAYR